MKIDIFAIIGIFLFSATTNEVYAVCAEDKLEWWEPCNDTGLFSDGIYVKYSILIPILIGTMPVFVVALLVYRRNRK